MGKERARPSPEDVLKNWKGRRPKRQLITLWIDPGLLVALRSVRDRFGVTVSEQIRGAIEDWLTRLRRQRVLPVKAEPKKAERKRASTRKRS
jgi:hypothetical protein